MSSRLIVLAPGDVIESVRNEIHALGIDIQLRREDGGNKDSAEVAAAKSERGEEPGKQTGGSSGTRDVSDISRDRSPNKGGQRGTLGGVADGAPRNVQPPADHNGDGGHVPDATTTGGRGRAHDAGDHQTAPTNGNGSGGAANHGAKDEPMPYYVASERLATLLRQRGKKDVEVFKPGAAVPPNGAFLWLGPQALKSLGAEPSEGAAQKDAEADIRRLKTTGSPIALIRIHGASELDRRFPPEKNIQVTRSSVVLVTNLAEYAPRAHILFTAPTGDTGWKAVAREATRRPNIRAYAYKEDERESPGVVLLHLITSS
ncbi:helicase [Chenuda virus]|uniref:Helicase n=1 Tax=Chenuda virus TaxID=40065 RepID=A0A0H4M944_9REOV|nr:helicase [Chenuda virus]AKP24093.1 helicase [Chenuda virus]